MTQENPNCPKCRSERLSDIWASQNRDRHEATDDLQQCSVEPHYYHYGPCIPRCQERNIKAEAMDRALATEEFTPARKCLRCDGRGWVSVAVGYDWRNEKCPDCKGSGERPVPRQ